MQRRPEHDDGPRIEAATSIGTVATATGVAYSCAERPQCTEPGPIDNEARTLAAAYGLLRGIAARTVPDRSAA